MSDNINNYPNTNEAIAVAVKALIDGSDKDEIKGVDIDCETTTEDGRRFVLKFEEMFDFENTLM